MYAPFFGLQQEAFSIAPDPRFLHLSTMHREALAHLLYGLQGGGGFVLLTGEIGTGKTTVCRCFLDQMPPGHRVAYVYNPQLTALELLQTVCQEFGIAPPVPAPTSAKPWVDALNEHLLRAHAAGEQCLLVIDEAQGLSVELLEQLRLLTNLETRERKLLQIVLIGQPELRTLLARPELEQLAQRVIARVHLGPLSAEETVEYITHRLAVAGWSAELPFDRRALALVHRLSGGVPRRINLLCQRCLLGAYAQGTRQIGPAVVRQAAAEVFGADTARGLPVPAWSAAVALLLVAAGAWAWWWHTTPATVTAGATGRAAPPTASAPAAAAVAATASAPSAFADERTAWAALATPWSLDLGERELCDAALQAQLACHQGTADLALLHKLQRPALLTLHDGGQLLLLGLDDRLARVQGAQGPQRLPRSALSTSWSGRYVTLWRPPPGWATGGDRRSTEVADWVLTRLQTLQGEAASGARSGRDDALRQRVFAFQVGQGLALDGVAGPITLMQINRASGVDEARWPTEP